MTIMDQKWIDIAVFTVAEHDNNGLRFKNLSVYLR